MDGCMIHLVTNLPREVEEANEDDSMDDEDAAPVRTQMATRKQPMRRQPSRNRAPPPSYALREEESSDASDAHQPARPPPRQVPRGRNLPLWKRHDIQLLLDVRNVDTDQAEVLVKLQGTLPSRCLSHTDSENRNISSL